MKKFVSLVLTVLLVCSLFVTPAFAGAAYNSDVTLSASLDKSELTVSSSAQTVVLTVSTSKTVDLFSIGYSVDIPAGWSINSISSGSSSISYSGYSSTTTGVVSWFDPMAENKSASTIGVISVSVPANTPAGNYSIGVSGVELATEGQNNDNAWMKSGSASAQLTIKAPKALDSISVKTAPTKTSYIAGQNFDSTGMVIEKKYNDNSTATATGWTVTDGSNLTAGKTSVTISYTEGGVTKTTTQAITVTAKAVSSIAVKTQPSKTVYNAGESFNTAGMVITVTYNDGSSEDISTGFTVSPSGALTTSNTTVTISYGGKTTTVNITVNAVSVTGVSLNKSSTTIKVGNSETLTATVAPANATNKNVTWSSNNASVATVDQNGKVTGVAEGTATITVTTADGSKTATCSVTVEKSSTPIVPPTPDQYSIDAPSNIQNGSVTVNKNSATVGSTVTITVTPDKGYKLDTLTVKDAKGNAMTLTKVNDTTYTFKMPASKVTISATFVKDGTCTLDDTCPAAKFTDLDLTAWYHDGVHFCVENGLIQGYPGNLFGPEDSLTRAQIVMILWRMEECPVANYVMTFKDVKADQWYTEAIRWAQSTGIVAGYSTEAFGPNDPITREQMATILYRYAKYHDVDVANTNTLAGFDDLTDVSSWALDAMKWANAVGLVKGRTTTTLVPAAEIKRVEAAAMIQRYCENIK